MLFLIAYNPLKAKQFNICTIPLALVLHFNFEINQFLKIMLHFPVFQENKF